MIGCAVLTALEYVKTLPQWSGEMSVHGGSQGGFLSLTAAGVEPSVKTIAALYPWMCDIDSDVSGCYGGWHPYYTPALAYYKLDTMADTDDISRRKFDILYAVAYSQANRGMADMNKSPKPINTRIYDFTELVRGWCARVDKTALLYGLAKPGAGIPHCLPRPRRFGKSPMATALKAPFRGWRELFDGLAIERKDWNWENDVFPVVHLGMSNASALALVTFQSVRRAWNSRWFWKVI